MDVCVGVGTYNIPNILKQANLAEQEDEDGQKFESALNIVTSCEGDKGGCHPHGFRIHLCHDELKAAKYDDPKR